MADRFKEFRAKQEARRNRAKRASAIAMVGQRVAVVASVSAGLVSVVALALIVGHYLAYVKPLAGV